MRLFHVLGLFLAAGLLTGCVRTIEKPEPRKKPPLFVGREPKRITLTWDSKAGEIYSLKYKNKLDKSGLYKTLPGHERIVGTGQRMQRALKKPPRGEYRFRLDIIKPASGTAS